MPLAGRLNQLKNLPKKNIDVFAWEPSDMTGVPKRIIKHSLNADPLEKPVSQKKRVFCSEKTRVVTEKVAEWLKAGIVRLVKHPIWISNHVLVKKVDRIWRMCIDYKNINAACPKDYYPMPKIYSKIEAVIGFPLKCFLDAYKGYHQVQMAKEDEEKIAFYTDQGTYCYPKIPFGLKNTGATYQRLIDGAFQSHIGRNLEAYVDDMVIKSMSEREMLADIVETFDNLRRINMKLNPKKCSFGVEEGKFLGYMVTSEGIRPNPAKTKDLAEIQSPKTWGEMQSLAEKLEALNRFLSRSAENSLPFFETLKDITKENKPDYRWTEKAKNAFQKLKKMILDLPALTTHSPKESLFVYLAASKEAISTVPMVVRQGKQYPVHYEILVETLDVLSMDVEEINKVVEEERETWITPIINCLERGIWSKDHNEARALRMKINQYVMKEGVLFKRSYLMPIFWCVGPLNANYVIREIHMGACIMHLKARSMVAKAIQQGHY
nr:reverse transcriptase domain-containing protein [Tanacetum cinerariifolium]GFA34326.1 reverse transcriptase domain-containing protein [Tanacetum cinerariifolium]